MKKILLFLVSLGAFCAFADDSYLYWMVGGNESSFTYDTVKVRGYNGGVDAGYLTLYAPDGETSLGESLTASQVDTVQAYGAGLYAKLASDKTYSSFVVELWNDSSFAAKSDELSYSEAVANYIETANSLSRAALWTATSFAIPEPNSGLLMLIGCAALGLRRRRARRA